MSDPSYMLVRVKPPPEQINDKVAFTFNNLSFANLSQKVKKQNMSSNIIPVCFFFFLGRRIKRSSRY
jgi:hypothetical protein